jgi:hypothetical protein
MVCGFTLKAARTNKKMKHLQHHNVKIQTERNLAVMKMRIQFYGMFGAAVLFLIVSCFLISKARVANAFSEIRNQDAIAAAEKHGKDISCYEKLHDATFLYLDVYRTQSGTRIAVGKDDEGACDTLARRNKRISEGGTK